MYLRKTFLPRSIQDAAATFFFVFMIPITFWFELWIVIPEIHGSWSFFHTIYFILGLFLLYNISANLLAVILVDTSTKPLMINPPPDAQTKGWIFCATCEAISPPRSWHCPVCDVCILKRDHHCMFSGSCVGHANHRYFIMLLVHLVIATAFSSIYNSYYLWFLHGADFRNLVSLVNMLFPVAVLMVDSSTKQYYLVIYLILVIGSLLVGALLFYHWNLVSNGIVVHEKNKRPQFSYNYGFWENWKVVLGEKYYLAWISPFIESPQSHDGIYWEPVETNKNR
ncbi:probable palmitoyltransferase ZDHHC24 [Culicoides brevitarsis]|uniref:probable palmitoyltransferase ZDHHC24 n=1 Tax=Culicoides brevitarsis TaxID=469753 RepID=UPI00307BB4F9